ncbi:MAG TPA: GNAT family N-acetyltransferase [Candidatus Eremiobacteraceae bacterium]|nr:GNAT family N-acetyltransferase [Candidatus Eremiobacteraceae bacterium]
MTRIDIAGPSDLDTLVPLFDAYRVFYEQPSDPAAAREFLTRRLSERGSLLLLARWDGAPAGLARAFETYGSIALRPLWILEDLYVIPDLRKHGIASALIERAQAEAKARGASAITLETAATNATAQRLYERLGYARERTFIKYGFAL